MTEICISTPVGTSLPPVHIPHGRIPARRDGLAGLGRLLFAEARPGVQAVFALRFVCGALACGASRPRWSPAFPAGVLAWFLLCCAIYILNGWSDRLGDRLNGSRRPIASGALPARQALGSVIVLYCGALALAGAAAPRMIPAAVGMIALGCAYSVGPRPLKAAAFGAPLAIGAGAALSFLAGSACTGAAPDARTWWLLGFCGWVGAACCTKDFSDVVGDRLAGRRTWPVRLGVRLAAARIGAATGLTGLGLLVLAASADVGTLVFAAIPVVLGSIALPAVLTAAHVRDRRLHPRLAYRAYMTTQYTVLILMLALAAPAYL